jgi:hypothetical protein
MVAGSSNAIRSGPVQEIATILSLSKARTESAEIVGC